MLVVQEPCQPAKQKENATSLPIIIAHESDVFLSLNNKEKKDPKRQPCSNSV